MDTRGAVVVRASLERKLSYDKKIFCTRIRALGLTAYGSSWEDSLQAVKRMFATLAELHRRSGTLEEMLRNSKLEWCYESEYEGAEAIEVLLPDGRTRIIKGKNQAISRTPQKGEC